MSKYKVKDIESSLSKKGFQLQNSHHKLYIYCVDGTKTGIRTFVSHGKNEYSDKLLNKMRSQLKLSRQQFNDLIQCPLSKEELNEIYSTNGYI
jgi:hypothetical protein